MSAPVPPSWKDLGKSSNDLLSKDFPIAGSNLEVKTKAPNGVVFKVGGSRDKAGLIKGDIESKYADPKNGITFTPTWTTSNQLKSLIELDGQIAKGLKVDLGATLDPASAAKSASVTSTYKQPGFHTRALIDLFKGPTFTADAVVGRDGFLVGGEAAYNVSDGQIKNYNAAVGYSAPDYSVTFHGLSNLSTFSAAYYHRVNKDVEAAAKAIYNTKSTSSAVNLEVGAKTYLDNAAFVKAKVNNAGMLVLGYTQALRPGVKTSWGLALDTQKLNDPTASANAHSVGFSLTFDA